MDVPPHNIGEIIIRRRTIMENLLKAVVVILALYGLGMLSKKNESRVERGIDRIAGLFRKKKENNQSDC